MVTSHTQRAFTLIELLVTISIISMLASIVVASVSSTRQKAQAVVKFQQLDQVRKALELYYADNGSYPDTGYDPSSPGTTWMNVRIDDQCGGDFLTLFSKSASDLPVIPGLVPKYIAQLPNSSQAPTSGCKGYFYLSNGKNYKYLEYNTYPGSLAPGSMYLDPYYPTDNTYDPVYEKGVIISIRSSGADMFSASENWNIQAKPPSP